MGLQDTYAHGGSKSYLMKYYGIDGISLVRNVEQLLGQNLEIEESDLQTPVIQPVRSTSKAEDL
jgi:transketolase